MPKILLNLQDRGWAHKVSVWARGFAFYDGRLRNAAELSHLFSGIEDPGECQNLLRNINGFFAIIIQTAQKLTAAVDRVRSIPIFYRQIGSCLYVSDNARNLLSNSDVLTSNPLLRAEFRLTGHITGPDTLSASVSQLQAGEVLFARVHGESFNLELARYYLFLTTGEEGVAYATLFSQYDGVLQSSIERLIAKANGRKILVPLSGGWDSRLIVLLLKRCGYSNVLCFSYGRLGNDESEISKEVAAALGFEWVMVPYCEADWWNWFHSEERAAYFDYAHNLVSVPHLQDWPAIWQLKKDGIASEETLVAPGHGGSAAGGRIPPIFLAVRRLERHFVSRLIFEQHYNLWPMKNEEVGVADGLLRRVEAGMCSSKRFFAPQEAAAAFDLWDWEERQAKFIINSVRVYDFWGVDWWMPLTDADVLAFWQTVPLSLRVRKRLHVRYVTQLYVDVAGVSVRQASRKDGSLMLRRALDTSIRLGLYRLARSAYRHVSGPIAGRRLQKAAYDAHSLAWYGILDKETFEREFTGTEIFHSFIAKSILGELTF
jgi:asparagine synthase (glutamine-hydrolysing)